MQAFNNADRSDFDTVGSVVIRDIPANVVAAGNPCRVIKEIAEVDRKYYYKDRVFDEEAWANINNKNNIVNYKASTNASFIYCMNLIK